MKVFLYISVLIVFFCIVPQSNAATITLSGGSPTLNVSDEFTVGVSLTVNAADGTTYYLRGIFYQPGSTNYCGYTWNGTDWYNSPIVNGEHFLQVTITNSTTGQISLKAKVDSSDSGCTTSGTYSFKVLRYTGNSGSSASDTINELSVNITIPTPTPSPTSTPTPQPIPSPTKTPTASPTPKQATLVPTKIPTSTPTRVISMHNASAVSISPEVNGERIGSEESVLSATTQATMIPTKILPMKSTVKAEQVSVFPVIFIAGGMLLVISCGIVGFQIWKKKNNLEHL